MFKLEVVQICILFQKKTSDCKTSFFARGTFCSCMCYLNSSFDEAQMEKIKLFLSAVALAGQYLKDVMFSSFKFLNTSYL